MLVLQLKSTSIREQTKNRIPESTVDWHHSSGVFSTFQLSKGFGETLNLRLGYVFIWKLP
jgi:hypothetical protein